MSFKKCQEVSKNAKIAFFGTKNAKLATMLLPFPVALLAFAPRPTGEQTRTNICTEIELPKHFREWQ